jgi:hypothetical protein
MAAGLEKAAGGPFDTIWTNYGFSVTNFLRSFRQINCMV